MVLDKKAKEIAAAVAIVSIAAAAILIISGSTSETVQILYFRNDGCSLVANTDNLIREAKAGFGNNLNVTSINASLNPGDPKDSGAVASLRQEYGVVGLPEIVINGRKMESEFDRTNLFREICNNFISKPLVCL